MGIEAPVKANHQRGAFGIDHLEAGFDALDIEVDRLFAEDGLAGAGELFDQVGMGVGGRADDDCVDIGRLEDRIDAAHFGAILSGEVGGSLLKGIGHGNELGLGAGSDGLGMHLADAAGAEQAETNSHFSLR